MVMRPDTMGPRMMALPCAAGARQSQSRVGIWHGQQVGMWAWRERAADEHAARMGAGRRHMQGQPG